jgi:hypothetical protein
MSSLIAACFDRLLLGSIVLHVSVVTAFALAVTVDVQGI